ncbi:MAG: 5-formyltetrahydrofolate cyclo-ligase [Clostridiales bacterium]|nr:5-formyltetrahydrofolate cyclo-ligase [Clostridiales bacterium]
MTYTKKEARLLVRGYRKTLSHDNAVYKSVTILDKIMNMEEYKQATCIYAYASFGNEVMTRPLIQRALSEGKKVALPKVIGKEIEFFYINSEKDLVESSYGILEPKDCEKAEDKNALLIMPGVAFDKNNNRVGYGAGYYDKYLEKANNHYKIALAYKFQVFESIYNDDHDIKPDLVLTEERGD